MMVQDGRRCYDGWLGAQLRAHQAVDGAQSQLCGEQGRPRLASGTAVGVPGQGAEDLEPGLHTWGRNTWASQARIALRVQDEDEIVGAQHRAEMK